MRQEKFKVIQFIRELIVRVDKELSNFPKKDVEIKNRIRTSTYDLLEMAYEANSTTNILYKKELLYKLVAKIKVIDFLINLSYDKGLITVKKYYKFGEAMNDIAKYLNGWINAIKDGSIKYDENGNVIEAKKS